MWCKCGAPRSRTCHERPIFSPSHHRYLGFLWSGRRDSNPRSSPWQGDCFVHGVRPSLLGCASVPPVSIDSARDRPCCRPVYYGLFQSAVHCCAHGVEDGYSPVATTQTLPSALLGKPARWLTLDRRAMPVRISTSSSTEYQQRFTMAPRRQARGLWRLRPFVRRK